MPRGTLKNALLGVELDLVGAQTAESDLEVLDQVSLSL